MMLVEEGKIDPAAPAAKSQPELANMKVGVEKDGVLTLEPARRAITVQDLLRHTSGLTYGAVGRSMVKDLWNKAGLSERNQTLADLVRRVATLPLAHQPGSTFDYGMSRHCSTSTLSRMPES
jgi:CubicO group peptidase (beta-lactamase class C family)